MLFKKTISKLALPIILLSGQTLFAEPAKQITTEEIKQAQKEWANAIVTIGKVYDSKGDYKAEASKAIDKLYGYSEGSVLFKPTKASVDQFRETKEEALSYFVATGIEKEDHGFAIKPWTKVRFDEQEKIVIDSDSAIAMGNYYFTDKAGQETKVEFSFGYKRAEDSRLVIFLHHSSMPFNPEPVKTKNKHHD